MRESRTPTKPVALTRPTFGSVSQGVTGGDVPAENHVPKTLSGPAQGAVAAPDATGGFDKAAERRERDELIAELALFRDVAAETVERMPLGFVALDHGQQATYANAVALALVGLSLSELVGRRPWDVFPQIVGTRHQTVRVSAAITVEYEEQIGPRERWVGVLACPIQTGTAVFLRDITERKRAEETVRRSVALTHGSLDPLVDAFLLCSAVRDDEGVIVDFNVEFANGVAGAFMSRTPDALMGALTSAMTPDWAANLGQKSFLDACREVIDTGEAWADDAVDFAVPRLGGDSTRGTLSIQIARFNDGFFATWRDVTESQRRARERERLVAVVEQSLDGIIITDAAGQVTYANPSFLSGTDLALGDIVGRPVAAVALAVAGPEALAAFEEAGVASAPWLQEIDQKRSDGTAGRFQISLTPAEGAGESLAGYVVVIRDVTLLRDAEAEVILQTGVRAALAESLRTIPPESSLDQAAQAICDQLVTLAFVDVAVIQIFLGGDEVEVLAQSAPPGYPVMAGTHLPPARAATVLEQAARGPWARYAESDPDDGGLRAAAVGEGLKALAYGPIVHGDQVVGTLVLGTFDERFARILVEKMPGIVSFGVTSSALLAERMYRRRQAAELRGELAAILAARAFHPVFQPIVDLESRAVVGYEALTRFDSGQRPDLCFADAWSVGLGSEFEIATLEAAVAAGRRLPKGVWLDLNVSPRLLADPEHLRPVLWDAGRPIVLEVTEHEVIEDYDFVRGAFHALGNDVRLAVDDAGVGIANFGHIIELRPDFVKLDISLVRRVNAHLGRQAMVVGMRHFSRTVGCRLIAEGVETVEEARTLTALGVEFGQGYLFGHPEPVEVWAASA
jgi:PAS domain S-box-containing protein